MKQSRYNYIIHKNGIAYWYNGLSHAFFKLSGEISLKLENLLDLPYKIEEQIPSFYNKLVKQGFLIDDDVNELNIVHELQQKQIDTKDCMMVIIPTMNCNYTCWYCVQSHVPSVMSKETVERILTYIRFQIISGNIKSLQIEWFGGEPFLQFGHIVKPLGEKIYELCNEHNIPFYQSATTNGYFLTPNIINNLISLNFKQFQITLDGDRNNHNKIKYQDKCDSTYDHVLNNIRSILSQTDDIRFLLRINYDYTNISSDILGEINSIIPENLRKRITIFPHKVWQTVPNREKNKELFELWKQFKQSGYKIELPLLMRSHESCYVNRKNYVTINYNGEVVKCTSDGDLNEKGLIRPGKLEKNGEISWKDKTHKLLTKPTGRTKRCTSCKFLPLCFGPCPKYALTEDDDYCKMDFSDSTFEDAIVEYIDLMTP